MRMTEYSAQNKKELGGNASKQMVISTMQQCKKKTVHDDDPEGP